MQNLLSNIIGKVTYFLLLVYYIIKSTLIDEKMTINRLNYHIKKKGEIICLNLENYVMK